MSARIVPSAPNRSETSTVTRPASPSAATLSRAIAAARGEVSSAMTRAPGRSHAIAHAMHPVPVPTSITSGDATVGGISSSAHSASNSVSGRGTRASGPTRRVTWRNGAVPSTCCSGSRFNRRRRRATYRPASAGSSARRRSIASAPRGTRSTLASSHSASTTAVSMPASRRAATPAASAVPTVGRASSSVSGSTAALTTPPSAAARPAPPWSAHR